MTECRWLSNYLSGALALSLCAISIGSPPASADTAKASPPHYKTEQEYLVSEIALDTFEMISYAKDPATFPAADAGIRETAVTSGGPSFEITLTPPAGEPEILSIQSGDFIFDPENFVPACRQMLTKRGLAPRQAGTNETRDVLLQLLEGTSSAIEDENQRASTALARGMLDPDNHETAAAILAAMALRESAGMFDNNEGTLCRIAAHLAMSRVLRSGGEPSPRGAMAGTALQTLCLRQRPALAEVQRLRATATNDAAFQAWMNILAMRNTHDWRPGPTMASAPRAERMEYFRALCTSVNPGSARRMVKESSRAQIPDWSWIALAGTFGVEDGHIFCSDGLKLTLQELAVTWQQDRGSPLPKGNVVAALNVAPGRCMSRGAGEKPVPRVISWGCWAAFYQRHVMHVMLASSDFLRTKLSIRDDAYAFEAEMSGLFDKLVLFPYLGAGWARDAAVYRYLFTRGADLCESQPWRVGFAAWGALDATSPYARPADRVPSRAAWFLPAFPHGTAYDLAHRITDAAILLRDGAGHLDAVAALAPYERALCEKHGWPTGTATTDADLVRVYGALIDYDVVVMQQMAALAMGQPEDYIKRMQAVCKFDPDKYLDLAEYLRARGMNDQAAEAYERGLRDAHDQVRASNNAKWLVDYYMEAGRSNDALVVANRAADVYSARGLETKASLLERMGKLDVAEVWFKRIEERYPGHGGLNSFYGRHPDYTNASGKSFGAIAAQTQNSLFPRGLQAADLADFKGPPLAGALCVDETSLSRAAGMRRGVVIVALDGYKVETADQYRALRDKQPENVPLHIIYWNGSSYAEVAAQAPERRLGFRVETYHPQ